MQFVQLSLCNGTSCNRFILVLLENGDLADEVRGILRKIKEKKTVTADNGKVLQCQGTTGCVGERKGILYCMDKRQSSFLRKYYISGVC